MSKKVRTLKINTTSSASPSLPEIKQLKKGNSMKPETWDTWNKDQQWGYLRGLAMGRLDFAEKLNPAILKPKDPTEYAGMVMEIIDPFIVKSK